MRNIFVISDTHFGHANVLTFKDVNGLPIRPLFNSVEDMDETMISNWNEVVKPQDIIYHLGDVAFGPLSKFMPRLNGHKRLILGNHDPNDMFELTPYFKKIYSWRKFTEFKRPFVLCHYPLHINSFKYKPDQDILCIHGHIHEKIINDPYYVNVCVERTGYKPVALEEIVDRQ